MSLLSVLRPPLEDAEIIDLYFARDERAISETDKKYRKYLLVVARNFVSAQEDCEECLNDTYVGAWEAMPPQRPSHLKAFLTSIIRRVSINKYNEMCRQKRVPSALTNSFDEIEMFVYEENSSDELEAQRLGAIISEYIKTLGKRQRYIFMSRYYMAETIDKIASELSVSRSTVNKEIAAIKEGLRLALEREGYKI